VIVADVDVARGQSLASELGSNVAFVPVDVTNEVEIREAVCKASQVSPLRIAVSCAGVGAAMRLVNKDGSPHDFSAFQRVLSINLFGTFNVLRLAAAQMAAQEPLASGQRGVVVNTASIAAFDGQAGQVAYSASKGAIVGLTLPAARDLASRGIRVCTVCPGTMDTPLLAGLPKAAREHLETQVPFPARLGHPSEFAGLVMHICDNDYLNGEVIRLDGGLRMPLK